MKVSTDVEEGGAPRWITFLLIDLHLKKKGAVDRRFGRQTLGNEGR